MTKTTLATGADRQAAMSQWRVVDASGQVLGRMAAQIAQVLMGKHRPDYTPHMLVGEGVIVINAERVKVTGDKRRTRDYTYWTGYPGGLRHLNLGDWLDQRPDQVIELAVRRMLPKNRLGARMLSRLKVYVGSAHPHAAQKPASTALNPKQPAKR